MAPLTFPPSLTDLGYLLLPPLAGGIIGYFTNDLAIKMLFRPYRPLYWGGRRLPFTPGLIPSNQKRLAQKVADAILGSLLTPEELQKITRALLERDRTEAVILWLLQLALDRLRQGDDRKTAQILGDILHDLFSEALPRLVKNLAQRDDFLADQLDQVFDRVILDWQISDPQAQQLADWLLEVVVPPNVLRQSLVDFLTDPNIQIIDDGFRDNTSGTYWLIANVIGVRTALTRLRSYCLDEKENSNRLIASLIQSLEVRLWLQEWLQNLSIRNFPPATVQQLRQTFRRTVREYLRDQGAEVLQELGTSVDWYSGAELILNRLQHSPIMDSSLAIVSTELALVLERYLEKDLESIVAQVIPLLNLEGVIISRIEATSPENLEAATQSIVRSELQAIVNLGGVLGFVIGCLQTLILLTR
ncbi:MAG: DUF445 domain-containing protein [Prochlorothrix sp.]|nr:DUF445 family protein [Prochlorothrix sp.]